MSDQHSATSETPAPPPRRRRGRSWLFVTTVALAAGLTGAVASRAISQQHWHGHGFMGGVFDPARIEDGADRGVRHLAIEIDATNEQQEKLRAIVKGAIKDLLPMREKALSARQRGRALLTQPSVDRAAIEALRAAGVNGKPINRALASLRRFENRDGGFALSAGRDSDAQSTAFAIQAFVAAGASPPRKAFAFLASLRRPDGSYRYSRAYATTPVWVTAQVLPALVKKPFPLRADTRRAVAAARSRAGG